MAVLCSLYHVRLITPGLSTGPCRVSNLLGFEQNKGGGRNRGRPWSRREAERFLFAHPGMPSRPDLSVISASGSGVSQVSSSKKDKKLALDSKIPRRDFLAHFRCKHSQEQSPGADISATGSACQCADASRKWA